MGLTHELQQAESVYKDCQNEGTLLCATLCKMFIIAAGIQHMKNAITAARRTREVWIS